jgi:hypothetical protein
MTPDKKSSAAEIFLRNFLDVSRMPRLLRQVLQSHQQPKSLGMEVVLLTDLKCDDLAGRINRLLSHILFSVLLPPFAYLIFISPFHPPFFIYSFFTACLFISSFM